MGGGEEGVMLHALGCKREKVGVQLAFHETGDRVAISLLQHLVCVHGVIL